MLIGRVVETLGGGAGEHSSLQVGYSVDGERRDEVDVLVAYSIVVLLVFLLYSDGVNF